MQEIQIENTKIKEEFIRWSNVLGSEDPYESNDTIGIKDVLRAHFLIADYFYGEDYGLGGVGPKDTELLHSSLYRQFTSFGGINKWKTPFERCATLVFGIVKDHPFHDANKRTSLLTLLYFLNRIKRVPTVKQVELENLVVDLANGDLKKRRRMRDLGEKTDDPEIYFIADYIKRNSRTRDTTYRTITYNQLNHCLKSHGYCLDNIKNGSIDVLKKYEKRKFLGLGKKETVVERVLPSVPFQKGWKSQVSKGVVSKVRQATKLDVKHGVDSASFFEGVDPLQSLIAEYNNPLKRLAFR